MIIVSIPVTMRPADPKYILREGTTSLDVAVDSLDEVAVKRVAARVLGRLFEEELAAEEDGT